MTVEPVKVCEIDIMQYLDADGLTAFSVRRDGDVNMSTWIGLLELAKDMILREYNRSVPDVRDEDDEDG